MRRPGFFGCVTKEIRDFDSREAVYFFRELLWAEASDTGVIQSSAHVPQRISIPDGGIDAIVDDANPTRTDFIPNGDTSFQIQSSDILPHECKKEVRTNSGNLKQRIENLLKDDGAYILVIFEELAGVGKQKGKDNLHRRLDALEEESEIYHQLSGIGHRPASRSSCGSQGAHTTAQTVLGSLANRSIPVVNDRPVGCCDRGSLRACGDPTRIAPARTRAYVMG